MSVQVGDILKMVAILNWVDGDIMQNVFNAVIGGTGGPYDDEDIVDDALAWIDALYTGTEGRFTTDVSGSEVRVYIYDSVDDDWDEVGSGAWTFVGTDPGDVLPRGVALLVNAKTIDPDVSGKKYLGGATESGQTDGLWTSTALGGYATWAAEWVDPFVGSVSTADWITGVWSVKNTVFKPFTGTVIIPTIPAYQRRRKQGVGI